jgi:transposase
VPRITVTRYLERARLAGLEWPAAEGMDDHELEQRLFGPPPPPSVTRPLPDWGRVYRELRRNGVTMQLLWFDYKEREP